MPRLGLGKAFDSVLGASGLLSIPGLVSTLPMPALEAQLCLLSSVLTSWGIKKKTGPYPPCQSYCPAHKMNYFTDKGLSSQSYGFPSSHVWM